MKKRMIRLLVPVLTAIFIFTGCAPALVQRQLEAVWEQLEQNQPTSESLQTDAAQQDSGASQQTDAANQDSSELSFSQMEYRRPDMEAMEEVLTQSCLAAKGTDLDAIMDSVWAFYDEFDLFYTYYSLADIHYSLDLTNEYWEEEYAFCTEKSAVVDASLEELYYALAASPCRKQLEGDDYFGAGFFDSYDGENSWDEAFTALLQRETELQNQYYALSGTYGSFSGSDSAYYNRYADELAQLLIDLIQVRHEMADYWGYESYAEFAWDFYYYRDYTPWEMETYMEQISRELVPLYREMAMTDVWDHSYIYCTAEQNLAYVRDAAEKMGGAVSEAFEVMQRRELYDISYSANKYAVSFEIYLNCYEVPFVFVYPFLENYDKLTFSHEFGHFCNDYHSYGSVAGIDVMEVFSQGMEYLMLCYSEDSDALARVKLADSLGTYVEQAAFATFEHRIYELEDPTVQDLYDLYDEVALKFGFDSVGYDPREFVTISHMYTNPLYMDSYVVSNDAAMQLYQLELENPGEGLALYEGHLDTQEVWFLGFLDSAGLESPFASGRLESVRELFRQELLS